MPQRLAITGGRDYRNRKRLFQELDREHATDPIEVLISGRCPTGTDHMAEEWAKAHDVEIEPYPAKWDDIDHPTARIRWRNGKPYDARAGFRRNTQMLVEGRPTKVLASPGGPGTADMVSQARSRRFQVPVVEFRD